jgi:acetyl esterase/lipase
MTDKPFNFNANIPYKTPLGGKALKLDLFRPKAALKATLLYAHGGGFIKGSRKDKTAKRLAEKLAGEGVTVASVDYRLKTDISAFTPDQQPRITNAQARTARIGMPINPQFCGPRLYAALEDLSDAIDFLRRPGPLLVLGVSSGGIAALSLAFPPRDGWENVSQPDGVIGLSSAMVQPWRLASNGVPSLLFNGPIDRIISPENSHIIAHRASTTSAPLQVIITDRNGHNPQVDLFIDGDDANGKPWLDQARKMMNLR